MSRIIITGGPGSGKTTVLKSIESLGYRIVSDSPRAIIRDRISRGLPPRPEARDFAQQILQRDIENYERHITSSGHVFFDRSALDALCALDLDTPLSDSELDRFLSKYRYYSKVFILPPWEAIYVNDTERDHLFDHAELVYSITQNWYRRCGYELVQVPRAAIAERRAYILQALGSDDA